MEEALKQLLASKLTLAAISYRLLLAAVDQHGSTKQAAVHLGISRQTAHNWLKDPPDGSPPRR
jgi:molybdenum-dependent DNA-binding transcriptional regulator ModE